MILNRTIVYENSKLPKELFLPFETIMIKKHLDRLIERDLVTKDKDNEKFKAVD